MVSCDNSIENGDLVYLSLRKDKNLSVKPDGGIQCANETKTPLIYLENNEGSFSLKTEEGQGIVLDNYYLFARDESPSIFKLDTIGSDVFIVSSNNRYFSCNGEEVYETFEPDITILKY